MRKLLSICVMFLLCQYSTRVLADDVIDFADANVKALCVANWDKNGDGELSETEAAAVTDLGTVFKSNQTITSFNELQYFTGLTSIGERAFYYCHGLTSITIPGSVTSIKREAFNDCVSLTSITIPERVTSIGEDAFYDCFGLTSITISGSVTSIGKAAFGFCNLTSIKVETGNTIYDSRNNCNAIIETATNTLIAGCKNTVIPNSVTSIGASAFIGCFHLTSITIPSSVTSIERQAFYGCVSLTSITIPGSVTSIERYAFFNCYGLTSITIPGSVTSIGEAAFGACSGLTSIKVGTGNTKYDSRNNCNAIIETATNTLIAGCKNTVIPNSVTSIGSYAFDSCSGLTSITIPNSVTSIGAYAFGYCKSLTNITSYIKEPFAINDNVFNGIPYETATLYVPTGTMNAYRTTNGWKNFQNIELINSQDSQAIDFADANVKALCVAKWDTNGDGELSEAEAAAVTNLGTVFKNNEEITSFNELQYFTGLTSIASSAFYICSNLTSITIPGSVTSIESRAFYHCNKLTSITIPEGVTNINANALAECDGLTSIKVETGNTTYDSRNDCNAIIKTSNNTLITGCKNTVIPNSVTSLGAYAFRYCVSLTSITIPESVTNISQSAFNGCSALTSISVETGNTTYDSRNDCNAIIKTATNTLIAGCKNTVIPNSVTSIGSYAFYSYSGLTSITIPGSVTGIERYAFSDCSALTDITSYIEEPFAIDNNVFQGIPYETATLFVPAGTIDAYKATDGWKNFQNIELINSQDSQAIDFADANVKALCVANWDTNGDGELSYDEAAAVTDLGTVFKNNEEITSFNELQYFTGLTSIDDNFYYCKGLTSLIIPNSVTSIEYRAFYCCRSLTSVTIPNSVTSIGEQAFDQCRSLTSITIPESVTSIDRYAFYGCSGLTSIKVETGNTTYDSRNDCNAIIKTSNNTLITGCKNTVIPNSVTSIGSYAFYSCSGLTSITIPGSVTSIGYSAFYNCSGLTSITIPESVTDIGGNVFKSCSSLTSIKVETGNTKYDSRDNCNAIIETKSNTLIAGCMNTVIPNTVTSIGEDAFFRCQHLTSITIPNSVTSIGEGAFESCSKLTSITIPSSVTSIGYGAFSGCIDLTSITIPNSVTSIGIGTFAGCSSLTSITIPESVTSIGEGAFYDCTSLTSITIPNSVTSIGGEAFGRCSSLTEVYCYAEQVPTTHSDAFSDTNIQNATLYVPKGSVESYKATSPWSGFGTIVPLEGESEIPIEIPNDLVIEKYTYTAHDYFMDHEVSGNLYIGIHGDEVYIQGMSIDYPNAWIKGRFEDETTVVFASGQLLTDETNLNFIAVNDNFDVTDQYTLIYNPESGVFEEGSEFPIINSYKDKIDNSVWQFYYKYVIKPITVNPSTHTLTLTASGNGAVSYGSTSVRSSSQSFDIAELPEVVLTITPDAGYHVGTLTINGVDALSQLTDGKLSIGSMTASVTVDITFASNVIDFADADVKAICVANWDTNGDGELSEAEAAAVTDLGTAFKENETITSFDEFHFFTGLTNIGKYAFYCCFSLSSITIPKSVTSIDDAAFFGCRMASITIPKSVTCIGMAAFSAIGNLSSIEVENGNTVYDSRDNCNAIIETASNKLIAGCKNTVIPNSVTSIGDHAFDFCTYLTSIIIPNSVTSIGYLAFGSCNYLTSLTIPSSVTSIDNLAFSATGLTSIEVENGNTVYDSRDNCNAIIETASNELIIGCVNTVIPNSVTSIGDYAFYFLPGLTSITIPEKVTSIGSRAFRACRKLTEVYCYAEQVPSTDSDAFYETNIENATLYVPKGSVESYKATSPWSDFGTIVEIPSEANPDINNDGNVDVGDIMTIINYIADDIYNAEVDLNDDGFVDIGDIMVVINVIIKPQDNSAGVKALRDMTDTEPVTENNDYLSITNEDNIVSIQLDNEFEYSAFQMLVTLPDGVDVNAVMFNSERLDGFTKFAKKVNERQYIIIGFSMDGNVIAGSTGKILSLSTTGNADDNIIISEPIFSIPEAKTYKLRVDDSYTTNLQDIQLSQFSVRGNTVYVYANRDTTLNIYTISGALCEQRRLHSGVNTITLRSGQYIINNHKVSISK